MAKKPARYSPELRAEAVKAVIEGQRSCADVARDFGLVAETVRNWVIAEKKMSSGGSGEARDAIERARMAELERRVRELEQENLFL